MNKSIIGAVLVFAVTAGSVFAVINKDDSSNELTQNQDAESSLTAYSKSDVAEHNSESDCWTYINNKVYDLTEYIPRHPGGDEVLRACGVDGTSLFEQRKTDDGEKVGSGFPHSDSATSQLGRYLKGQLN